MGSWRNCEFHLNKWTALLPLPVMFFPLPSLNVLVFILSPLKTKRFAERVEVTAFSVFLGCTIYNSKLIKSWNIRISLPPRSSSAKSWTSSRTISTRNVNGPRYGWGAEAAENPVKENQELDWSDMADMEYSCFPHSKQGSSSLILSGSSSGPWVPMVLGSRATGCLRNGHGSLQ